MTAADVELVYEHSKETLLALAAAEQHHQNANTPTFTSHNLLVITLHWLREKTILPRAGPTLPTRRALLAHYGAANDSRS